MPPLSRDTLGRLPQKDGLSPLYTEAEAFSYATPAPTGTGLDLRSTLPLCAKKRIPIIAVQDENYPKVFPNFCWVFHRQVA